MSYSTLAQLATDNDMHTRVSACCALEGIEAPENWPWERKWKLASQPGWDAAYSSAIAGKNPRPGNDGAVITDNMILSAVQAIRNAESAS